MTEPADPSTSARRWLRATAVRAFDALRSTSRAAPSRRAATAVAVVVVALAGLLLGLALGARTVTDLGPFQAELRLTPALAGDTSVHIPPLGSLHFDSHDGPTRLTVQLGALDQARTQAMIDEPGGIARASRTVADDLLNGIIRLGFGGMGAGVLGAMILTALVFRDARRVAWAGGLALVVTASSLGAGAATVRLGAIEEPRYEGLLVNAPALVGDVQRIANEWDQYAEGLQQMIANVSLLYTTVSTLPVFEPDANMTRVMHVADLHLNPNAWPVMQTVVEQYDVDFVIDSGDIVDWGTGQESVYVAGISRLGVPYVYVRGNHDSEAVTQAAVAALPNAIVLDNEVVLLAGGLAIAGIGDPRFTPDRSTDPFAEGAGASRQRVLDAGARLAETINRQTGRVHIAVVHDPLTAGPLDGVVSYILAGHAHERRVGPVVEPEESDQALPSPPGTLLMVQGSTGGAGLRGLEGEHPASLSMSVLYFDDEQRLVAYDDITVGGHGLSEVSLQRHIVPLAGVDPAGRVGPLDGSPTPSPTR
jgi:predicted phosphodiesterase